MVQHSPALAGTRWHPLARACSQGHSLALARARPIILPSSGSGGPNLVEAKSGIGANIGPNLDKHGLPLVEFGPCSVELGPRLVVIGLADFGPNLADVGPYLADVGQMRSNMLNVGPPWSTSIQIWSKSTNFGRHRLNLAEVGPMLGKLSPTLVNISPKVVELGPIRPSRSCTWPTAESMDNVPPQRSPKLPQGSLRNMSCDRWHNFRTPRARRGTRSEKRKGADLFRKHLPCQRCAMVMAKRVAASANATPFPGRSTS